jgi:hypothetical protein
MVCWKFNLCGGDTIQNPYKILPGNCYKAVTWKTEETGVKKKKKIDLKDPN